MTSLAQLDAEYYSGRGRQGDACNTLLTCPATILSPILPMEIIFP